MTRALFLTIPLLAACVHTPDPCDTLPPQIYRASECVWRNGELDMKSSPRPPERPIAERPVDVSPPASKPDSDHSRDDNGGSSDGNSDDGNGGKS